MIRLIVVRHGRTALNTGEGMDERFRGTIDAPLAPDGLEQARATGRRLARRLPGRPLAAVYSSPLLRAHSTAEAIAGPQGLPVRVLPGLSSMRFGQWAGLRHAMPPGAAIPWASPSLAARASPTCGIGRWRPSATSPRATRRERPSSS